MRLLGFIGLFQKEALRFWRVMYQTIAAPVLSSFLYLFIFAQILKDRVTVFDNVNYIDFLIPGLVMMSVIQNAFANSSSSLIQSKISGNLTLVLLSPISPFTFFLAYVCAGVVRGVLVGLGVYLSAFFFTSALAIESVLVIFIFALLSGIMATSLGIIAGLWSDRFDQIALFTNFIIMPLTFLSGVFYSVHSLPPTWQNLSQLNPFFYMIDGFRYGFFNASDVSPALSLAVTFVLTLAVSFAAYSLVRSGYKVRH